MKKIRLAVWSGPRNISTSLMRSFSNRDDCIAFDEPFYGAYLSKTGKEHPLKEKIIKSMKTNYDEISDDCAYCFFKGTILYQKQMAHHIFPDQSLQFLNHLNNIFLIRKPEYVVKSFNEKIESFDLEDIGIKQQVRLFDYLLEKNDRPPLVVSASQILNDPKNILIMICENIGVAFDEKMLKWPLGPKPYDGVWGKIWYQKTYMNTTFINGKTEKASLTDYQKSIVEKAYPYYEKLKSYKIELE